MYFVFYYIKNEYINVLIKYKTMIKKNFLLIILVVLFGYIESLITSCYTNFYKIENGTIVNLEKDKEVQDYMYFLNKDYSKKIVSFIYPSYNKIESLINQWFNNLTNNYIIPENIKKLNNIKNYTKDTVVDAKELLKYYYDTYHQINFFNLDSDQKISYKEINLSESNFKKFENYDEFFLTIKKLKTLSTVNSNINDAALRESIINLEKNIIFNKESQNLYKIISKIFNAKLFLKLKDNNLYFIDNIKEFYKYLFDNEINQKKKNEYQIIYEYISDGNSSSIKFNENNQNGLGDFFNPININFEIREYNVYDYPIGKYFNSKNLFMKESIFNNSNDTRPLDEKKKELTENLKKFIEILDKNDTVEKLYNVFIKLNEIYKIYEERIKKITESIDGSEPIKNKLSIYNKSEFDKIERKYKKIKDILSDSSQKNKSLHPIDINKDDLMFIDEIIKKFSDTNYNEEKDDDDIVSHIFDDANIKELYIQMREVFQNDKIFNGNLNWISDIDKKEKNYKLNINDAKKNNFQNYIIDFFELLKINTPLTNAESKLYNFIYEFFKDSKLKDKIIQFYNSLQINNDDSKEKLEFRKGFTTDTISDLKFFKKDIAKVELLLEMFKILNINNNNENIKTIYNKMYENVENDSYKNYLNDEEKKQINSISFMKFNINKIKDIFKKDNLELLFKWNNIINTKNPFNKDFNNNSGPGLKTLAVGAAAAYGIYSNWDKIKSWLGFNSNKSKQRPLVKKTSTLNNTSMQASSSQKKPSLAKDNLLDKESIPKKPILTPKLNLKKDASKGKVPSKSKDDFDNFDNFDDFDDDTY